jgi:hypothetical protein
LVLVHVSEEQRRCFLAGTLQRDLNRCWVSDQLSNLELFGKCCLWLVVNGWSYLLFYGFNELGTILSDSVFFTIVTLCIVNDLVKIIEKLRLASIVVVKQTIVDKVQVHIGRDD